MSGTGREQAETGGVSSLFVVVNDALARHRKADFHDSCTHDGEDWPCPDVLAWQVVASHLTVIAPASGPSATASQQASDAP